jgi:hypothetical protein
MLSEGAGSKQTPAACLLNLLIKPDGRGCAFLRNVGELLSEYTVSSLHSHGCEKPKSNRERWSSAWLSDCDIRQFGISFVQANSC